jgi:hypothetical protein
LWTLITVGLYRIASHKELILSVRRKVTDAVVPEPLVAYFREIIDEIETKENSFDEGAWCALPSLKDTPLFGKFVAAAFGPVDFQTYRGSISFV